MRRRAAPVLLLLSAAGCVLVVAAFSLAPRGTSGQGDGRTGDRRGGEQSVPARGVDPERSVPDRSHPSSGPRLPASAYFDPRFLRTSAEYNRRQVGFALNARAIRWVLYLTLLATPVLAGLAARLERGLPGRRNLQAFLLAWLVLAAAFAALLPISFASGYVTEHRFGLSNQSAGAWLADAVKAFLVWGAVTSVLTTLYFALRRRMPRTGWTVFAGVAVAGTVLGVLVAPLVIDPLFYRFRPLGDAALRRDLVEMAAREGIRVDRALVVEASAKTVRENAYFTGLGGTKRVVLYDNLLDHASGAEVRQVLAHELGHWSRRHIVKGLGLGAVAIPLASWLLWMLHGRLARSPRLHLRGDTDPAGIPLLWLLLSVGLFLSEPIRNAVSRRFESEADRISLELTGDPRTFVESQRRMAVNNLDWVDPPAAVEWLFWTHPTTLERIRMAEAWTERGGP